MHLLRRIAPFFILIIVFGIYAVWLAYPIALVTADIGRHLMNGEVILKNPSLFSELTRTNFYTYTNAAYGAVNHHWLGGVFFRGLFKFSGWTGLHLSFIAVHLLALGIILDASRRLGSLSVAAIVALAALPLIGERFEIRPEGFAYLLFAVEYWILIARDQGVIGRRAVWLLPVLLLLWVNTHASFPVGLVLMAAFTLREFLRKSSDRRLYISILFACIGVTFLNPNGIGGVLEPFLIFRDPGYAVVENQSVFFLESIGVSKGSFLFLKIWTAILLLGSVSALRKRSDDLAPILLLFALALAALSFMAARNLTLLGFAIVPAATAMIGMCSDRKNLHRISVCVISVMAVCSTLWHLKEFQHRWIVIGLAPGANTAANFLKEHAITGPFFNDFDIAGYLIFHFYPEEKVFVSNVPEAHPPAFFRDVYIPMQQSSAVWREQMQKHDFNAIVVYYRERTQWMPEFLRARLVDPEWVPVFADDSVLVFLRRNEKNAEVIQRFQIPSSAFQFGS